MNFDEIHTSISFRVKHAFFRYVKYREIFARMATVEFLICIERDIRGHRAQQVVEKKKSAFI